MLHVPWRLLPVVIGLSFLPVPVRAVGADAAPAAPAPPKVAKLDDLNPHVLRHYLAGIQFAIGDLEADAKPRSK